jgi:hypothetical protein
MKDFISFAVLNKASKSEQFDEAVAEITWP